MRRVPFGSMLAAMILAIPAITGCGGTVDPGQDLVQPEDVSGNDVISPEDVEDIFDAGRDAAVPDVGTDQGQETGGPDIALPDCPSGQACDDGDSCTINDQCQSDGETRRTVVESQRHLPAPMIVFPNRAQRLKPMVPGRSNASRMAILGSTALHVLHHRPGNYVFFPTTPASATTNAARPATHIVSACRGRRGLRRRQSTTDV